MPPRSPAKTSAARAKVSQKEKSQTEGYFDAIHPRTTPKASKQKANGVLSTVTPAGVAAAAKPARAGIGPPEPCRIPLDLIDPSPFQARRVFDADELAELAASLQAHDLIQPVVVRPVGDRYELVAGERRTRAAKLAGWQTIRVDVRQLSDADAAALSLAENIRRSTLSPIEEAIGLRTLLQSRTQEALAQELGCTQGQVSNRVRLLDLPEAVQQRIMSREMAATHARHLLAWTGYPAVLQRAMKGWEKGLSEKQFGDVVAEAAWACSKPLKGGEYSMEANRFVSVLFKLTPEREKLLDVHEVRSRYGEKQRRAFDLLTWTRLQDEAQALAAAREEKQAAKKSEEKGKGKVDRRAEQERAASFQRRLREIVHRWKAMVVKAWFLERGDDQLLMALLGGMGARMLSLSCHDGQLERAFESKGPETQGGEVSALVHLSLPQTRDVLREYAGLGLFDPEQGVPHGLPAPLTLLEEIALKAKLKWEACWKEDRLGPLTEDFFKAHDKSQLLELCELWKLQWTEKATKAEIIAALTGVDRAATAKPPATLLAALKG